MALVFAAVISYDLLFFRGVDRKPEPSARPAGSKKERAEAAPGLKLSLLDRPRPAYREVTRDIFAPIREEIRKPTVKAIAPSAPPPPPQAVPPPPSRFKIFASEVRFLGLLEKKDGRTAFLSRGDEVYIVRKGDMLNGYRVAEITGSLLVLTDEESGEHAGIDLQR